MQKCTKCLQQKPTEEFYNDPRYNRPRTACKACYRRKSPVGPDYVRKTNEELDGRDYPSYPTTTSPGTGSRIEVYAKRFHEGYHLHHPEDERLAPSVNVDVFIKVFRVTEPRHEIPDED